ncbi:MAG: ABC transporter substrate-binding protein [Firmicutes bacterium]|nr:ABC transporter substrate-binding protein [Bacillota bacterium]
MRKKIIAYLSSLLIIVLSTASLFTFTACSSRDENTLRINQVTNSVFYAPFYVAMFGGFFEEVGLTIELTTGEGADASMMAVITGDADIALAGAESAMYVYLEGRRDHPVVFAQLTVRDGSFLVGRNPIANFEWNMLANSHIIAGRTGGLPAMTLQYLLNNHGLTHGQNMNFDTSIAFAQMASAFIAGEGDFVTLFEPVASTLVAQGHGHIIASVGYGAGYVPFTSFMATQSFVRNNTDQLQRFVDALSLATAYVYANTAEHIAALIAPQFPGANVAMLSAAIQNYKDIGTWVENLKMTPDMFNRLQNVIENAGFLSRRVPFETLVDNRFIA